MKTKLLLFVGLISSVFASAQITPPPGYIGRNTKEVVLATGATLTLTIPAGSAPSLNGGWSRSGNLYSDTVGGGIGLHHWLLGAWKRIVDSTELADTAAAIRLTIGSGGGGGGGSGTVNSGAANRLAYYPSLGTTVDDLAAITANRALISDANGLPTHSAVTNTELGYVGGVTSGIQTQVDGKQPIDADLTAIAALSPSNDDIVQRKSGAWTNRTIAQLKTDLNYTIPPQLLPTAGTNMTITGTYPNLTWNAAGDPNWVFLSDYGTPNDGLSDTAAIKAAVATGKNVYVTPGDWLWDGYRCEVLKGQIIRGYGLSSIITFTKDTCDVFWMKNDSSRIDNISFRGKGRGTFPGPETFTYSNGIYISGNANTVEYCYAKNVKGAFVTSWAGATIYDNSVRNCSGDSNTIGIYLVLNSEYGKYINNSFQHSRTAFVERCSGNNKWDILNGDYADRGFYVNSPGGCNGDHGSVSNSTFNHCVTAVEVGQTATEYLFLNVKMYYGNLVIGSLDTARQVIFRDCSFSTNTITTTKAKNCLITGGAFQPNNSPDVTVVGTTGIEFCNIMNSPYQSTTCGGGASLTNPMTTNGDIIKQAGGVPARVGIGSNGEVLTVVSGAPAWAAQAGGGDVSKVGTPVNNQIGVWTGSGTLEGDANFTWDGTTHAITGAQTVSTSVRTPLFIGTTGTTDGIIMKASTGAASGANNAFTLNAGNNGATQLMRWDHNGTLGIGTNPSSSYKLFMVSIGSTNSTGAALIRNSGSVNLFQIQDGGDWRIGNQSGTMATGMIYNRTSVGTASVFTPTAWLHLAASTTTANTASLKIIEGSRQTTPEDGTLNYVSNNLEFVETSTVYTLAKTLRATASLDFSSVSTGSTQYLTITVTGAATGDPIALAIPHAIGQISGIAVTAWVSSSDTITVALHNYSGSPFDPASQSFTVSVLHY